MQRRVPKKVSKRFQLERGRQGFSPLEVITLWNQSTKSKNEDFLCKTQHWHAVAGVRGRWEGRRPDRESVTRHLSPRTYFAIICNSDLVLLYLYIFSQFNFYPSPPPPFPPTFVPPPTFSLYLFSSPPPLFPNLFSSPLLFPLPFLLVFSVGAWRIQK